MKPLTNEQPRWDAKPDGERREYAACRSCMLASYRTGPFTWLQGHVYCEVCYPKMVAVLEADAKLAALKPMEITYSGPLKVSNLISVIASRDEIGQMNKAAGVAENWPHEQADPPPNQPDQSWRDRPSQL